VIEVEGEALERDAHQFLWDLGYLVLPRLTIHATTIVGSKKVVDKTITDLDAYGIRFGPYLERDTFLVDCKHRSEGVFSQALQALGVASLFGVKNLLVVRSSVDVPTQRFSELFGVRLVQVSEFRRRVKPRQAGSFSEDAHRLVRSLEDTCNGFQKAISYRASNAVVDPDPYRRLKSLRMLYQEVKRDLARTFSNSSSQLLMYRLFQYSQLALAEIAAESIHLSRYHYDRFLLSKTVGDMDFKMRAFERIARATNPDMEVSLEAVDLAPSYLDMLRNLVDEMRENPWIVQEYLRYTDLVIHQFGLPSIPIDMKSVKDEIPYADRGLFSKWNLNMMQVLDEEKSPPGFMIELLG